MDPAYLVLAVVLAGAPVAGLLLLARRLGRPSRRADRDSERRPAGPRGDGPSRGRGTRG